MTQLTGNWTQSYGYDSGWRMNSLTSPAGTFGYGYAAASASALVQSISLPNAAYIANGYDSLARLTNTALLNRWDHVLDGYRYGHDPLGLRTNVVRNLGLTTNSVAVGYDNIGQLTWWTGQESGGAARLNEQISYGFDAAGNLENRTNGALIQTFNVDALNQLSKVTRSGPLTLAGATPAPASSVMVNGNPAQRYGDFTFAETNLSLSNGTNTFSIVAENSNGLTVTNPLTVNLPATNIFQYDGNGNLTNDGTRTFTYDGENQLTNVFVTGQWRTDFLYDGLRRRRVTREYNWQSGQWNKTNEVRYLYDGMLVIQERDSTDTPQVTYTRGLDLSGSIHGAGGIGGLLARTDGNGSTFYHADGAGNVTALMDGNENIAARYEYDPFGKIIEKWGPIADANVYRFSSKEYQPTAGLYAYGFRFYEPHFQRWLNRDPMGEAGGIHLYNFANNCPLDVIDLDGRFITGVDEVLDGASLGLDAKNFGTDLGSGHYGDAVQDAAATFLDLAGALLPGDPVEGAGVAVTGVRAAEKAAADSEKAVADAERAFANRAKKPSKPIECPKKIPNEKLKAKPQKRGKAPIGEDGKPVELHHTDQNLGNQSPREEMTRTDHRGEGNFSENHPNTGQQPSTVNRPESSQQHSDYWKKEWDCGRFKNLPSQ